MCGVLWSQSVCPPVRVPVGLGVPMDRSYSHTHSPKTPESPSGLPVSSQVFVCACMQYAPLSDICNSCLYVCEYTHLWVGYTCTHTQYRVYSFHVSLDQRLVYVSGRLSHACPLRVCTHLLMWECGCVSACIYMGCSKLELANRKRPEENYFGFFRPSGL